jgi:hypothetical protein
MNLLDLQISFQQKITDVNPVFEVEQRPDTYTIINYLNRAIMDYLKKGFMSLQTFEQQLIAVSQAQDDLRFLIRTQDVPEYPWATMNQNWGDRGKRYRLPDNILIPLSLTCTVTRIEVQPYTDQTVFAEFRSRIQAERLIKTTRDQVIHVKPVAFIEDEFYLVVVGDAYVTAITADRLTYLRKPDKLSFDYTELTGVPDLDITSVSNGINMRMLTPVQYVNAGGSATDYLPGEKVTKVSGYNNMISKNIEPVKIGYPWGLTDTPDFPEHMHEDILERSTQLFLDEANLKLIPKEG